MVDISKQNEHEIEKLIKQHYQSGRMEQAVTVAIQNYGSQLHGFIYLLLHDRVESEEVYAQTCLDIWHGITEFKWKSRFKTWAYGIARNHSINHKRYKNKNVFVQISEIEDLSRIVEHTRTRTPQFQKTKFRESIQELRKKLSKDEQAIITLRVNEKMSWKEIAGVMNDDSINRFTDHEFRCLTRTYRKRFERIKAKLRKHAEEMGLVGV